VTEYLLELNNQVTGVHYNEDPAKAIENRSGGSCFQLNILEFFTAFSLVVTVNLNEKSTLRLASILEPSNIPLVCVWTCGFIGYVRISIGEHEGLSRS
jgi:hypothetical protein